MFHHFTWLFWFIFYCWELFLHMHACDPVFCVLDFQLFFTSIKQYQALPPPTVFNKIIDGSLQQRNIFDVTFYETTKQFFYFKCFSHDLAIVPPLWWHCTVTITFCLLFHSQEHTQHFYNIFLCYFILSSIY